MENLRQNFTEKSNNIDRKSIDFFLDLKDRMINELGFSEKKELKTSMHDLVSELESLQNINNVQTERKKDYKVIDIIKDKIRNTARESYLNYEDGKSYGVVNINLLQTLKNSDLEKWKFVMLKHLKKFEVLKEPIDILHEIELSPKIKDLLNKYKKNNLYELLKPELEIDSSDLTTLAYDIEDAFEYRNRKITELVAYRYAQSAPVNIEIEKFITNTQSIVSDKNDKIGYRNDRIKNNKNFNAPVDAYFVPDLMSKFGKKIENQKTISNNQEIQEESLKYYMLFELIHPFLDKNGRVGRALFVFLQRRFSEKKSNIDIQNIHIPIARYESGTINKKEVSDTKYEKSSLGSIALDVNELLTRFLQDKKLVDIGEKLIEETDFLSIKQDREEIKNKLDVFIDDVFNFLNSEENSKKMKELVEVIKKLDSLDDLKKDDFNKIYESMKNNLEK